MASTGAIVIGASGGIGSAVVEHFKQDSGIDHLFAVASRIPKHPEDAKTHWLKNDYSEKSIERIARHIQKVQEAEDIKIRYIVIAIGRLHDKDQGIYPEKKITDIALDSNEEIFRANCHVPMLWLKQLNCVLSRQETCAIATLSARVGSISDNHLGGWYAYRGAKAALNMMLKCYAIELNRRFPLVSVVAFHPGTTDTPLSEPFQANVPEDKLHTPNFVAERLGLILKNVLEEKQPRKSLQFLDYAQKQIEW